MYSTQVKTPPSGVVIPKSVQNGFPPSRSWYPTTSSSWQTSPQPFAKASTVQAPASRLVIIDRKPNSNGSTQYQPESLKEICDSFLRSQMASDKNLYPAIDDASSQFTKFFAQKVSSGLGGVITGEISPERNKVISNIYMMVMYLIATLKIFDLETRLMHLFFGNQIGGVADLVYKGALTLSAMKMVSIGTTSFEVHIPTLDEALALYGDDPLSQISFGGNKKQKGGGKDVFHMFSDDKLILMHNKMQANLKALWDAI